MGSYVKEVTSQDHDKDVLYTIKKSDYVGRYMVAARDIQPGETIFSDQPACIGKIFIAFQCKRSIHVKKFGFCFFLKDVKS